ncbi:MAG: spore coat associated protein CotJA [Lachnospiraceae bacterium]|uniref:Spore coat associated protein CotJA n=2 Tax=Hominifimenecus microfluidus TaxID=2885348 RepID=A0AAE3JGU3_9FIRM|nr:spore coat associated protein CotJA [Hominifimenecus microfluidus]MCC2231101.1 spore coat associated protein CotJA [Hominifimenecus microfluidus]
MAYVPWQVWQDLYDPEDAFPIGTIFRELDYPWEVGRCSRCR